MIKPGRRQSEKRPLKVAFLTSHPARVGSGSEKLMYDTASALFARGHDARVYVMNSHLGSGPPFFERQIPTLPFEIQIEFLFRSATGWNDFFFPSTALLGFIPWLGSADIWHFNNLHGHFVSLPLLGLWSQRKRIVISPVDQYLTTGHCPYYMDCDRYLEGCGRCPRPKDPWPGISRDSTRRLWRMKRNFLRRSSLNMFFHTEYLANHYKTATGHIDGPVIRYGVDIQRFRPMSRDAVACNLGINRGSRFVVGLLHSYVLEPRKGILPIIRRLCELAKLFPGRLELLVVGNDSEAVKAVVPPELAVTTLPFLKSPHDFAQVLNLCDVLLYPTRAENLSLTCLDSLACGVPVISYDVGGQREAITDGVNGFLVKVDDHETMLDRLVVIMQNPALKEGLSNNARTTAESRFDFDRYIDHLSDYYHKIL